MKPPMIEMSDTGSGSTQSHQAQQLQQPLQDLLQQGQQNLKYSASSSTQASGSRSSTSPHLRSSASFRVDEGYSEDMQVVDDLMNGRKRFVLSSDQVMLPDWMMALDESIRQEIAYKLVRTLPTSSIAHFVERLIPVLHLDFVTILPPELTLQIFSYLDCRALLNASVVSRLWRRHAHEPTLWRHLYKAEGWEYYEKEVRQFEDDIRRKTEMEYKVQMEARRFQEELTANGRGNLPEGFGINGTGYSEMYAGDNVEMDESHSDMEVEPTQSQVIRNRPLRYIHRGEYSFHSSSSADELYSSPQAHRISLSGISIDQEPPVPLTPTLLISGYGHPKLNWLYLYKQRRRLEENWLYNRYRTFQIPHPEYPDEGHLECIYTIQYSPNFLVSGSRDKTIRKWDIRTRRMIGEPLTGHIGSVLCLQFDESPEEDIIISGSSDSNVIVWRFSTGRPIKTIYRAHQESILNLRFNKKYLVTCSKDKLIKVWNRYELHSNMPDYPFCSKHLFGNNRISPSATQQITAAMRIQDPLFVPISPYSTIQVLHGHVAAVNAIQLHGDEIASASGDRVIKIWNVSTGACEKTMLGHTKGIACIQYDGKTVVSGSSDFSIRIFDRVSGADIYRLGGHRGLVRTVQASRDRIVSGSYDETVRVWVRRGAMRGYTYEGEDPNSFVQAAILKEGTNPPTLATGYGMGIAAVNGNSYMQIQQAIANNTQRQQQAAHQVQHVQMHMHHGQPHHHIQHQYHHQPHQQMHHIQHQNLPSTIPPNLPPYMNVAPPQSQLAHPHHYHHQQPHPQMQPHQGPAQPSQLLMHLPQPAHHHHHHHQIHQPPHHHQTHQNISNNTCKVFKLQFDTRWVICCCQDGSIMGWDFANNEPEVMEACRFFKAEGS